MTAFRYISQERLSSYKDENEYLRNIKYSESFYTPLAILEVALRNKIDEYMSLKKGSNWIFNQKYHLKTDSKLLKLSKSKLIPELSFGFWVHLLSNKKGSLSFTDAEFRLFFVGFNGSKSDIYKKLRRILSFRNRIFHYEKVLNYQKFTGINKEIEETIKSLDSQLITLIENIKSIKV